MGQTEVPESFIKSRKRRIWNICKKKITWNADELKEFFMIHKSREETRTGLGMNGLFKSCNNYLMFYLRLSNQKVLTQVEFSSSITVVRGNIKNKNYMYSTVQNPD